MLSSAGGPANSSVQSNLVIQPKLWHFYVVNFLCTAIPHGAGFTLGIGCSVSVDLTFYVDGHIDTGIVIPNGMSNFIQLMGFRGGTGGLVTNVTFDNNPISPVPPYPATPPLPLARASQFSMDVAKRPTNSNARGSQLAMEYAKHPTNSNGRVSAMVIEVLKLITPAPAFGFPEYIRRRIAC